MISEETAKVMMKKLAKLRKTAAKTNAKEDHWAYQKYESECLAELRYFVLLKTGRYRKFSNYEDLTQEGMEALLKAMKTFKGGSDRSFFYWAGLFVKTRIVRSANNHTVIRYPMHVAAKVKPRKESRVPVQIDPDNSPEEICEENEAKSVIHQAVKSLPEDAGDIVSLLYGLNGEKPLSFSKICRKKKLNRLVAREILANAMETLRDEIDF